jgi:hypothetical protein
MPEALQWPEIRAKLKPGQVIPDWTQLKGEPGDTFRIVEVKSDLIAVETPGTDAIQKVPRKDFEALAAIWAGYKAGTVPRKRTTEDTRYSKYIISIMRWCELQ